MVRGYAKQRIDLAGLTCVDNDAFATTREVASLACALTADAPAGPLVVSYGDVLFRRHLLDMLADALGDDEAPLAAIVVDTAWQESRNREHGRRPDFVTCSLPFGRGASAAKVALREMTDAESKRIDGEWMGVARFTAAGAAQLADSLAAWRADDPAGLEAAHMSGLFNRLVAAGMTVRVVYTSGHWLDVNHVDDLVLAGSFV